MDAHTHTVGRSHQGRPHPLYEFCACGHVRATWPSGAVLDWHAPTSEKATEARAIDAKEPKAQRPTHASDDPRSIFSMFGG